MEINVIWNFAWHCYRLIWGELAYLKYWVSEAMHHVIVRKFSFIPSLIKSLKNKKWILILHIFRAPLDIRFILYVQYVCIFARTFALSGVLHCFILFLSEFVSFYLKNSHLMFLFSADLPATDSFNLFVWKCLNSILIFERTLSVYRIICSFFFFFHFKDSFHHHLSFKNLTVLRFHLVSPSN